MINKLYLDYNRFDNASFGVFIVNDSGGVVYVNQKMLDISGIKRSEYLSLNKFEIPTYKSIGLDLKLRQGLAGKPFRMGPVMYTSFVGGKQTLRSFTGIPLCYNSSGRELLVIVEDLNELMNLQKELIEIEERYKSLVDNANEAIIIAQKGRIVFLNPKATEMIGYSRMEIMSKPFIEFIHPEDRNLVITRHFKRLKGENAPSVYSFRIIDSAKRVKWLRISSSLINWRESKATLSLLTDITSFIDSEQVSHDYNRSINLITDTGNLLLESTSNNLFQIIGDQLRKLVSDCIVAVCPYNIKDGTINVEYFTGVNESLMRSLDKLSFERMKRSFKISRKLVNRLLNNKIVPVKGGLYEASLKQMPKTVSRMVERLFSIKGINILGFVRNKILYGLVVMVSRSTKPFDVKLLNAFINQASIAIHKRSIENSLKISEEKYRTLYDSASDSIVITDFKGNIIDVNNVMCEKLGYSCDELIKMHIKDIDLKENAKLVEPRLNEVISKGEAVFEAFNVSKKGKVIPVEVHARKINYYTTDAILGIMRDISERKKTQQLIIEDAAKKELEMLRRDFLTRVSHELKQELMPLIGYARIMENETRNPEHKEYVSMIISSAYEMNESISKLVNLMKLEHGRLEFKLASVNLKLLIEEVIKYKESSVKLKNIVLRTKLVNSFIQGDPELLRDVLINLIDNAIKFSHDSGVVEISLVDKLSNSIISIKDYGVGIKKEDVSKLFRSFYQTKEGANVGGFGVGLALSKKIVEKHNGSIRVKSNYRKGTEFIVTLPRKRL